MASRGTGQFGLPSDLRGLCGWPQQRADGLACIYSLYGFLLGFNRVHLAELSGMAVILAVAVVLATAGVSVSTCLIVVDLPTALAIVVDEVVGSEHRRRALEVLEALVCVRCGGR